MNVKLNANVFGEVNDDVDEQKQNWDAVA